MTLSTSLTLPCSSDCSGSCPRFLVRFRFPMLSSASTASCAREVPLPVRSAYLSSCADRAERSVTYSLYTVSHPPYPTHNWPLLLLLCQPFAPLPARDGMPPDWPDWRVCYRQIRGFGRWPRWARMEGLEMELGPLVLRAKEEPRTGSNAGRSARQVRRGFSSRAQG